MTDEREISIIELLAACVRNAKKIIIFAIILALLAGAYQAYAQHNSLIARAAKLLDVDAEDVTQIPDWREKVDEIRYKEYLDKKDNYEETMDNYDLQMDYLQDRIENQRRYLTESLLMKVDPYNESETSIYFSITDIDPSAFDQAFGENVTPLDYVIDKIVSQYQYLWGRTQLHEALGLAAYADSEDKYIRELVSFSNYGNGTMRINAIGESQEMALQLAQSAYKLIVDNVQTVSALSYAHKLEQVSQDSITQINEGLVSVQEAASQAMEDFKTAMEDLDEEMDKMDASAPKPPETETMFAVIKFIIIGGVAGGVLACAWYVCKYLFNGRLGSSAQLQDYFGLTALGSIPRQRKLFDRWADSMCGEKVWNDEASALAYISDKAKLLCGSAKNVLILSTVEPAAELQEKLTKKLSAAGYDTSFAADSTHNPKAMELLKDCDSVILAESIGATKLKDIELIKKLAETTGKSVDGVVLF